MIAAAGADQEGRRSDAVHRMEQKNAFIDPRMGKSFVTAALLVLTIMSVRYLQNIQSIRNVQEEETRYNNKYPI